MLELKEVQKYYKDFQLNCSMQVKEGYVTGLIGANGAGKSTTFKAILGLIQIDGGTIERFGKSQKEFTVQEKAEIGTVLSEYTFSSMMTIKEVTVVMEAMYQKFETKWFIEKCSQYQLPLEKQIKDFSTGMKAKFKLLIAMSYKARLLILDEPTVGLDAVTRNELLDEMREYMNQEGRAILISSHISSDLEGLCDDLYFMQQGKILFHEDTDRILSDYAVLKVSEEQYQRIDKTHLLYRKKEAFGYELLTKERQYYQENYPNIVVEKGNIDDIIILIGKGEAV
ncbi:MAG: ABC transporter ATP-binding protein [Lachnospiraceae bacterium]|nr:ABC transporter ATP-binding protein [Lachnospiraceae bacterium]